MTTDTIEYYAGIMSGTSLDGIDAALVAFEDSSIRLVESYYQRFPSSLKQDLQEVCFAKRVELANIGQLDTRLGSLFAECAVKLFRKAGIKPEAVKAIGSHGQTLYHDPYGDPPSTQAIGDPNRIAEISGVTTVADFRRRDMVLNGQGAPLVPAFHQAIFSNEDENRAIVNVGGIANITLLLKDEGRKIIGFDTGPGNALIDYWANRHLAAPYDEKGEWAKSGNSNPALLGFMLQDSYFALAPPKSSGKEYFSPDWLNDKLSQLSCTIPTHDVQATLCHLTAMTINNALRSSCEQADLMLICGGGVHNDFLFDLIKDYADCPVHTTAFKGVAPDWVEAMAFAWLARQAMQGLPGNLPEVTGADTVTILGGIYPGRNTRILVN